MFTFERRTAQNIGPITPATESNDNNQQIAAPLSIKDIPGMI